MALFVGVAPVLGFGAARLLSAEVSGITQPRLTPRIADTAKVLLTVYLSLTIAEVVALLVAGMNLYDAVLHSSPVSSLPSEVKAMRSPSGDHVGG